MREILIDAPGAGDWVMHRVGGFFSPGHDHSFTTHQNGNILGGFVLCQYLGASCTMHMAGEGRRWCSRELLWLAFHYAFEQLGCIKLLGPVRSDNSLAITLDLRGGWEVEAVLSNVYAPGVHMLIMSMTRGNCPWLNFTPKEWQPNVKPPSLATSTVAGSA